MRRILLVLLVSFGGCVAGTEGLSEGEILAQAPVIREAPSAAPMTGMAEAEAQARLDEAREAFLREDYRACLAIIRKTLTALPPMSVATELRAMRFEARKLLFARDVLVGRVLPERDAVVLGEPPVLLLTLRNVSDGEIRIPRSGPGSSGAVFVVDVAREDWDIYGNVRVEKTRELIPLDEDRDLAAGAKATVRFELPPGDPARRHRGFSVYRVQGVFRPAVILAGEERYYSGVDLAEGVVRVLPPGYEPIAADPLGTLGKAWRLDAPEHLLLAAELSPPERRETVLRTLIGFLEEPAKPGTRAVMAALRRLTGVSRGGDPRSWIAWWKERSP